MDQGQIQQIGTPEEVYRRPANRFVATFLGRCNVIDGVASARGPGSDVEVEVEIGDGGLRLVVAGAEAGPAGSVSVVIRPEAIHLVNPAAPYAGNGAGSHRNVFDVSITDVSFLGDHYEYWLSAGDVKLLAQSPHEVSGSGLKAAIDPTDCRLVRGPSDQTVVPGRGEAAS
jgi:iron(III) transport system ATP-binding protein